MARPSKKSLKAVEAAKPEPQIDQSGEWTFKAGFWIHCSNDFAISERKLLKFRNPRDKFSVQLVGKGQLATMEVRRRDGFLSALLKQDRAEKWSLFERYDNEQDDLDDE